MQDDPGPGDSVDTDDAPSDAADAPPLRKTQPWPTMAAVERLRVPTPIDLPPIAPPADGAPPAPPKKAISGPLRAISLRDWLSIHRTVELPARRPTAEMPASRDTVTMDALPSRPTSIGRNLSAPTTPMSAVPVILDDVAAASEASRPRSGPPGPVTSVLRAQPAPRPVPMWLVVVSAVAFGTAAGAVWLARSRPTQIAVVARPAVERASPIPPGMGELAVVTHPPQALVTVDGTRLGFTPYVGRLDVGRHHVVVAHDRYVELQRDVEVRPAERTDLELALVRPMSKLFVVSVPDGAQIVIDGQKVGRAPVVVTRPAYEQYQVSATTDGCGSLTRAVYLKSVPERVSFSCPAPAAPATQN